MTLIKSKPPYSTTDVSAEKTQQQITELLRSHGISQLQWNVDYENDRVQLQFVIEYERIEDKSFHMIAVRVTPPMFAQKRRTFNTTKGKYESLVMANWAQSMRLLYYWLKAKIEAISWDLNSVEKEFLSDIITRLPDGTQLTIWELIDGQVRDQKLMIEAPRNGGYEA